MKSLFKKSALLVAAVLQVFIADQALPQDTNGGAIFARNYGQVPLRFEANIGLAGPHVQYISHGTGYSMYFAPDGVALALDISTNTDETVRFARFRKPVLHQFGMAYLEFENANTGAIISAEQTLPEKINYFIGNDPSKWRGNAAAFGRVRYQNIYPGIDLAFYGNESHLEYDFVVAPHANLAAIQIRMEGVDHAAVEATGDLALSIKGKIIYFRRPSIYQAINGIRHNIAGRYRLTGKKISFDIQNYDESQPLVIDPVLSYSTFLGGVGGAGAQLAVNVLPTRMVGQKAVVQLKMKNNLATKVKSARAVCFLLDDQGKVIGQSTKWVIGKSGLEPKGEATFNFVVSRPQPFMTTNLTARVSFSRVNLENGPVADVQHIVIVSASAK